MIKVILRAALSTALVLVISDWLYPILLEYLARDLYNRLIYTSFYHPLVLRLLFISGCLVLAGMVTITVKLPVIKEGNWGAKVMNSLPGFAGLACLCLVWLHLVDEAKEALAHLGPLDVENIKIAADVLPLHLLGFIPSVTVLVVYIFLKLRGKSVDLLSKAPAKN